MRKMLIRKRTVRPPRGKRLTLTYAVVIDTLGDSPAAGIESYGVSIAVRESHEEAVIRNITLKASEILMLADMLADNLVTPVTLSDVVYDWLCRI